MKFMQTLCRFATLELTGVKAACDDRKEQLR